jgi:phosphoglycolate phosphatase
LSSLPQVALVCCGLVGPLVEDGFGHSSLVERAFAEAIATQGVVSGTRDYARCMAQVSRERGRSAADICGTLFPENEARAQAACLAFERSYRATVERSGLTVLPGADDAMDKLAASGIRVCLITSLPGAVLRFILDTLGWRGRTDLALCPDDVPRSYPSPDLILTAMVRLGANDVREVAVATGTEGGIIAGHRAGAATLVGVQTGPHSTARLRRAGATHLIESIATLPDLVTSSA